MTIYDYDENGEMFIEYDSRWRFPQLLGFHPEEPIYQELQEMWEEYTGKTIPEEEKPYAQSRISNG